MRRLFVQLALLAGSLSPFASSASGVWQQVSAVQAPEKLQLMHPQHFLVYTMNEPLLKLQMWNLSADPADGMIISLPLPDGSARDFKVWQTPMMEAGLAAKYPDIKTYSAEAVDNRSVTAKIDFTSFGFHAMIFDGENTSFVDPYDAYHDGFYLVHYKRDEQRTFSERMVCQMHTKDALSPSGEQMLMKDPVTSATASKTVNGYSLRTYRLAVSADNFYCAAAPAAPTIATALSKVTTTMNRVNGVYEREFSITMKLVATEDQIIWPTATGSTNGADPFNAIDNNSSACLAANQTQCDTRIGTANYDIGHVFTTGGGGLSSLGCVCSSFNKANSVTGSPSPVGDGFDIDYVAHEMGHEFGAEHPFNDGTNGSCGGGNRNGPTAYEPGSGSTIMAYAGICSPDDIQPHSDAYFHAVNLVQVQNYVTGGGDCSVNTPTGNKLVAYSPFVTSYTIPYLTPFELTAPVLTDSVADSATLYCWEQWNKGGASTFSAAAATGPIFRSYSPTAARVRVFPKMSMVIAGTLSNAGTENNQGEKVPTVDRFMTFRCTFRDIFHNHGCFTFPDDSVYIHAVATPTSSGFAVTSQGTTGLSYAGGGTATVTWNVVGTNAAPCNAPNVDIYMSVNASSFPYFVGNFPNNGSATITVPNPAATSATCRFKVKGSGNVFFNVNGKNFTVTNNPAIPPATNAVNPVSVSEEQIKVYPVPATSELHISSLSEVKAVIVNAIGQKMWEGEINGQSDLQVGNWAKGLYYIRFAGQSTGDRSVRSIVIE